MRRKPLLLSANISRRKVAKGRGRTPVRFGSNFFFFGSFFLKKTNKKNYVIQLFFYVKNFRFYGVNIYLKLSIESINIYVSYVFFT